MAAIRMVCGTVNALMKKFISYYTKVNKQLFHKISVEIAEVLKMGKKKERDTYNKVRVFEFPNMIVRVYFPDITEEENKRRMKQLYDAAEELLREVYKI